MSYMTWVIQIIVILKYLKKNSADNSKLILFKLNYLIYN